jgi:hypothetical protein
MRPKVRILIFIFISAAGMILSVNLFAKETAAEVQSFPRFEIGDPPDDRSFTLDHVLM